MSSYQAFAVTARGSSHIKHGKDCQDYSLKLPLGKVTNSKTFVAIADGHGDDNCFRSNRGARFACDCASRGIVDFENEIKLTQKNTDENNEQKLLDENAKYLIKHIIKKWQIKVQEDYEEGINENQKNNFTEQELALATEKYRKKYEVGKSLNRAYGTTLIAAMVTERYWLGIHIGDGRFTVLYENGEFDQPVPWDEKCFLNLVTSICDDDAAERARSYFSLITPEKPPPVAVFLCSDGVDDNYPVEENEKHLYKLYSIIVLAFAEDGFDSTCKQLEDLVEKFATEGKGDDTSIAGFIDMERLKKVLKDLVEKFATEGKWNDTSITNFIDKEKLMGIVQKWEEVKQIEIEREAQGFCRYCGKKLNFFRRKGIILEKKCPFCGKKQ